MKEVQMDGWDSATLANTKIEGVLVISNSRLQMKSYRYFSFSFYNAQSIAQSIRTVNKIL